MVPDVDRGAQVGWDEVVEGAIDGRDVGDDAVDAPGVRTGARRSGQRLGGLAELLGLVGTLPGERRLVAAEVAVRGGPLEDRPAEVEPLDDRCRAEVEDAPGPAPAASTGSISEVPNVSTITDTGRATPIAYATCTSQRSAMPAATMFLADVAHRVRGRAVDLRRVLARERPATVARHAAVGVDDDLAAGETAVGVRTAELERAGGVAQELEVVVGELLGEQRCDDVLEQVGVQLVEDVDPGRGLGGDEDRGRAASVARPRTRS